MAAGAGKTFPNCYRKGHRVYAPSLTGMADRSHLVDHTINLTTHIDDIVNLLKWEALENVVLCGHSYGGMVISGVAEKVPEGTIGSIVFLDAVLPENGYSLIDYAKREGTTAGFKADPVTGLVPAPPPEAMGLETYRNAWLAAQMTAQPLETFTEKLVLTGALEHIPVKAYILATDYPGLPLRHEFIKSVQSRDGWRNFELPCGHEVMLEMPERLVKIFKELIPPIS